MNQQLDTGQALHSDREQHRVMVSWRARLVLGPNLFEDAKVTNISEGGMGLIVERPFPDGARLDVAIAIPALTDRTRLHYAQVQCRVAFNVLSNKQFRIGVQFLSIDSASKQLIHQWLVD
ncbi:MAG: PilZ domain-containing protein [Pseudomonadota bacterium]